MKWRIRKNVCVRWDTVIVGIFSENNRSEFYLMKRVLTKMIQIPLSILRDLFWKEWNKWNTLSSRDIYKYSVIYVFKRISKGLFSFKWIRIFIHLFICYLSFDLRLNLNDWVLFEKDQTKRANLRLTKYNFFKLKKIIYKKCI